MATIQGLKKQVQDKFSVVFKECNLFFAYSNEQLEEGKALNPLEEGDEYVRVAGGGILPSRHISAHLKKTGEVLAWYEDQIKENNLGEAEILYELRNHECFYTGDIEDAMDVLSNYTEKQVREVYNTHREKETQDI